MSKEERKSTTHSQPAEEELLDQGIKPNTIRLSIGTGHIDDMIYHRLLKDNSKSIYIGFMY